MPAIFRLRMLSDENDNFVRDYQIAAESELTDFHKFICSDLKFDASQMASFFRSSTMWEKEVEYTLLDMGMGEGEVPAMPMQGVKLNDVISAPHDRMIYLFDIFGDRALYMELVEIVAPEADATYPRCTASRGEAPDQFEAAAAEDTEGSIFDDVMSEFNDFEGDDSYNED